MPRSEGISCSGGLITLQSSTTHVQTDTPVCIFPDEHRMLESRGDDGLSLLFSWSPPTLRLCLAVATAFRPPPAAAAHVPSMPVQPTGTEAYTTRRVQMDQPQYGFWPCTSRPRGPLKVHLQREKQTGNVYVYTLKRNHKYGVQNACLPAFCCSITRR